MSRHRGKRLKAAFAFLPALKDGVYSEVTDKSSVISWNAYNDAKSGGYRHPDMTKNQAQKQKKNGVLWLKSTNLPMKPNSMAEATRLKSANR